MSNDLTLRPIRTEADYRAALARVVGLACKGWEAEHRRAA